MRRFLSSRPLSISSLFAIVLALLMGTQGVDASHTAKSKAQFLSWNTKKHAVTFSLTAGLTPANHTLNFNGYTSGGMVVSVPKGYRVTVKFTNKSTFPHSAVFTSITKHTSSGNHPLAFPGASSPDPAAGTPAGTSTAFSFVVKRVGTYAIVCEVGHHADAGMWDVFKVTKEKRPSIKLMAPAASPQPTATPY